MTKKGSYLKVLHVSLGMIIAISEAAAIHAIAADIPAEYTKVKIEYITEDEPPKAAGLTMPARTHDVQIYTDAEKDELCRIAQAEAGNQYEDGMWLVMSVVINRVHSEDFPDSIDKVLHQPGAFCAVKNGSYDKAEPSEDCCRAFERISSGDVAPEVVAFETVGSDVLDQYFSYAFTHKDHKFYTKK